jgi:hypothetical protein
MSPTVFPTRESPLLKVKRSVNCPVVLLYPIPFEPERERREIFVVTTPERLLTSAFVVLRFPEREAMVVFVVLRFPESEKILFSVVSILPERPRISPVAVARYPFVMRRLLLVVARFPESESTVAFVVLSPHEREVIAHSFARVLPESDEVVFSREST